MNIQKFKNRFDENLSSVDELIQFDKLILDVCIQHIEELNERLKNGPPEISNNTYLAESTLKTIKTVRKNDSLRTKYLSMFNSCLVLQVSYFSSVINDIFKYTCESLTKNQNRKDLDENVLKSKNDINFQNMISTTRTFKKYLSINITKDDLCNTIILAQSSRHAIVHSLGIADKKFISQIKDATPRDVKSNINLDDKIQFTSSELVFVKIAMQLFVLQLIEKIKETHKIE